MYNWSVRYWDDSSGSMGLRDVARKYILEGGVTQNTQEVFTGFNGLDKNNCKTRRETLLKFGNLVFYIRGLTVCKKTPVSWSIISPQLYVHEGCQVYVLVVLANVCFLKVNECKAFSKYANVKSADFETIVTLKCLKAWRQGYYFMNISI